MTNQDGEKISLVDAVGMAIGGMVGGGIFATGRVARRVETDSKIPARLTRWVVNGVPVPFLAGQVALAVLLLFTTNLAQIVSFSSLVFLLVFSVVNTAAVWHGVFDGWKRILPTTGGLACLAAAGTLVVRTASEEPETLAVVGGIAGLLLALRLSFKLLRDDG